ncbi:MAG: hypothetical protein OHK0046_11220 [Anaerolineae bacterium]
MYRKRQSGNLFLLIMIGILAGGVYLVYDVLQRPPNPTEVSLTPRPPVSSTAAPTADALASEAQTTGAQGVEAEQDTLYSSIQNATIFIPSIGIEAPVIQVYLDGRSWNVDNLGMNVGHLQGTNWMSDGQPGNIVLSGHVEMRDGRRGIFAGLETLAPGDRIVLTHEDEERLYAVTEIRNAAPDDLTPLYPTETDRLTLVTCDSYDFFSDSYLERTIVVADRIG